MAFDYEKKKPVTTLIVIGGAGITLVGSIAAGLWWLPRSGIYQRTLAGKAALMEAESTRQVRVLEAKARMDFASLEAKAEFEFVEGEWRVKHVKCNVWGDVMEGQLEESDD